MIVTAAEPASVFLLLGCRTCLPSWFCFVMSGRCVQPPTAELRVPVGEPARAQHPINHLPSFLIKRLSRTGS